MLPPWEDQARFGWLQSYLLTIRLMFTRPTETYARMPRQGNLGLLVLFTILTTMLVQAISLAWSALLSPLASLGDFGREGALGWLNSTAGHAVLLALVPVMAPLALFVTAGVLHLTLMLVGGARQGLEATIRAVAYAETATLLGIVPFCGGLVGGVWVLVLYVIGLRELHGTTTGRAALAVVLPAFLCCGLVLIGATLFAGGIAALTHGFGDALGR